MGVTTRIEKGLPLSHLELDDNFKYSYKWAVNVSYEVGMVVSYEYNLWECLIDHISSSIFEFIKWKRYGSDVGPGAGPAGVKFFWKDSTQQSLTTANIDDMGVRLDILGRPVYKWNGSFWAIVEDPNFTGTGNVFTLDGPASVVPYSITSVPAITTVKQALDKLFYVTMNVILTGGSTYEIGTTVADIVFNWIITGGDTVVAQTLARVTPSPTTIASPTPGILTYTLTGANVTVNTTYSMSVQDSQVTKTSNTNVVFLPKLYWGSAAVPGTVNSSFINGLASNVLSSTKAVTATANILTSQYFWFCLPASYGVPTFTVGGFAGGFFKVTTITHTNSSGYAQSYDVWRSDNPSLGFVTANIT